GIVKKPLLHRTIAGIDVQPATCLHRRAAVARHRVEAFDEIRRRLRQWKRTPAQLVRWRGDFVETIVEVRMWPRREGSVHRRGTDSIQPTAPARMPRRGERGAGELLGIQAIRRALR